ncbi:hypothetical protein RJ639_014395 [Escallonia herrerae]|uniref:Uncharacterized protein n=1 Tax=Escallonia herrerae TaxID=1293975 RepID=A0AA88VFQ4_9ASTE|nr:hypothetical protein RJ639_014395 [Escallonia herrerae]
MCGGEGVKFDGKSDGVKEKITSRVDRRVVTADNHEESPSRVPSLQLPNRLHRDLGIHKSSANEGRKMLTSSSPEEEDRQDKEEDFMAMKGCKPPQRPKRRANLIQKSLLFVSPTAWLLDLCGERYEVREKKTSKKRPRGSKATGSLESDSD